MMKNCELPEFGFCDRAIPTTPRSKGSLENSAGRSGCSEPPVPGPAQVEAVLHVAVLDVAGLRHEAVDHPVEGDVVVLARPRQRLDPLDVLRRHVGQHLDDDLPPSLSSIRSVFSGSLISAMAFLPGNSARRTLGAPPAGEKPQTRAPTLFWANFSASARATMGGTKPEMSPPSRAISLTSREAIAW